MAQKQQQQVILSPSHLPCTPHTTYYSNLFVLKTTVAINGQQAEITFSEDGELTLNCRYPSTKCLTLNYHTISAELESIFRKYGVNRVNNCWCELDLYFQVSFHSQECMRVYLSSQKDLEIKLSSLLSQHLPVSEEEPCSTPICEVEMELFLIIVDTKKRDTWVEAINEGNYLVCLSIWKESAMFEFGSLFRAHQFNPGRAIMNDSLTLVQLVSELADVVEWFSLGLYLGVPEPDLLKIEAGYRGTSQGLVEQCKTALLSWWLKNGELSWSAVVRALEKIKMTGLAQKIAIKYGVPVLQPTDQNELSVSDHELTAAVHVKEDKLTSADISLNAEMRKKASLSKRRAQEAQALARSSSKIRKQADKQDEGRMELGAKEHELDIYKRLQPELTSQQNILDLNIMIARKEEEIKYLKEQLDRMKEELSQAKEASKQQREHLQQTMLKLAVQCEKTRNLKKMIGELKRERLKEDQQLLLSVARKQGYLNELFASTDKEEESLKQEIEEKESTMRELSSQLEVKEAEEKELEECQLAQVAAEISDLRAMLEKAEDGKIRAKEKLENLQDLPLFKKKHTKKTATLPQRSHSFKHTFTSLPDPTLLSRSSSAKYVKKGNRQSPKHDVLLPPNLPLKSYSFKDAMLAPPTLLPRSHSSAKFAKKVTDHDIMKRMAVSDDELQHLEVKSEKEKRRVIKDGKNKFKSCPKEGIKFLQSHGVIGDTAEDVAMYLMEAELDKGAIRDYLGEGYDFNIEVLKRFINLLDFTGKSIVDALRVFLWSFHLPSEAQTIDRIMELFAERLIQCNPKSVLSNPDTAYVLAYSVIMLHTGLHDPNRRDKPTVDQFISMNQGINGGDDLPKEFLASLYESVKQEQFKVPDEGSDLAETFFNPEREGYLTKEGGRYKSKHKRWFILKDSILYYFRQPSDKDLIGSIPLETLKVRASTDPKAAPHSFEIYSHTGVIKAWKKDSKGKPVPGNHDIYRLQSTSDEECELWIKCIEASIQASVYNSFRRRKRSIISVHA